MFLLFLTLSTRNNLRSRSPHPKPERRTLFRRNFEGVKVPGNDGNDSSNSFLPFREFVRFPECFSCNDNSIPFESVRRESRADESITRDSSGGTNRGGFLDRLTRVRSRVHRRDVLSVGILLVLRLIGVYRALIGSIRFNRA